MGQKRLARFLELPLREKNLLVEAWIMLGVSRGMVLSLPFRWIAPGLRANLSGSYAPGSRLAQAETVGWAIRVASRLTPWKSNCLAQAIAGKRMLQRRQLASTLFLGVRKGEEKQFEAHAWLNCESLVLTGGHDHGGYSVVSTFPDEEIDQDNA